LWIDERGDVLIDLVIWKCDSGSSEVDRQEFIADLFTGSCET